jgi:hypothetical protein
MAASVKVTTKKTMTMKKKKKTTPVKKASKLQAAIFSKK